VAFFLPRSKLVQSSAWFALDREVELRPGAKRVQPVGICESVVLGMVEKVGRMIINYEHGRWRYFLPAVHSVGPSIIVSNIADIKGS
jgi:hypothetical protein